MPPEFSREVVSVLVAAIIGSVTDPEADRLESTPLSPQPTGEAVPDARAKARLARLLRHYDYRVLEIAKFGMPERMWAEYGDVRRMLEDLMEYRLTVGPQSIPSH